MQCLFFVRFRRADLTGCDLSSLSLLNSHLSVNLTWLRQLLRLCSPTPFKGITTETRGSFCWTECSMSSTLGYRKARLLPAASAARIRRNSWALIRLPAIQIRAKPHLPTRKCALNMVSQAPSFQKKAKKPEEKSQSALSTGLQARRREAPYYWIVRPTSCKRQVDQTALKSNLTTSDPFLSSKPAEYIHSAMTTFRKRPHSSYLHTLTPSSHLPLP